MPPDRRFAGAHGADQKHFVFAVHGCIL